MFSVKFYTRNEKTFKYGGDGTCGATIYFYFFIILTYFFYTSAAVLNRWLFRRQFHR
jgi:hypothetical protein